MSNLDLPKNSDPCRILIDYVMLITSVRGSQFIIVKKVTRTPAIRKYDENSLCFST